MPFVGGDMIGQASRRRKRVVRSGIPATRTPVRHPKAVTDEQWIALEPCVHRLGKSQNVSKCETCGERGNPLALYHCALHGEVSIKRKNRSHMACATCTDRVEPTESGPS